MESEGFFKETITKAEITLQHFPTLHPGGEDSGSNVVEELSTLIKASELWTYSQLKRREEAGSKFYKQLW